MKKLLFILLLIFSLPAFSQEDIKLVYEGIKFMGIPMEGPISNFETELKKKGIEFQATNNSGDRIYTGRFAGHMAIIIVNPNSRGNVNHVGVKVGHGLNPFDNWNDIYYTYSEYKSLFGQKYGELDETSTEKFENGDLRDSDKFYELKMGRCKYTLCYKILGKVEGGSVVLEKYPIGYAHLDLSSDGYIQIVYESIKNFDEEHQNNLDDI